jgi:N-sulfoglucosamine sulfohydrolase
LFGSEVTERKLIFAARDKMDSTHDAMRMVRSKKYKLIHNLMPERAWLQLNEYKEKSYPMLAEMNVLNMQGKLTPAQAAFFAPTKPEFELFDLESDPHEINNLADDPALSTVKADLLAELNAWRKTINDPGVSDEFRAGGWPSTYPTRTLEEWQTKVKQWEPWVFRDPDANVPHPAKMKKRGKK